MNYFLKDEEERKKAKTEELICKIFLICMGILLSIPIFYFLWKALTYRGGGRRIGGYGGYWRGASLSGQFFPPEFVGLMLLITPIMFLFSNPTYARSKKIKNLFYCFNIIFNGIISNYFNIFNMGNFSIQASHNEKKTSINFGTNYCAEDFTIKKRNSLAYKMGTIPKDAASRQEGSSSKSVNRIGS